MAWYRGNLHMHSYWSDGHDFPEMVADWFKCAGYDFIAFTEHDQHQTGIKWVSCESSSSTGRTMSDGDLLQKYIDRYGRPWVETRDEGEPQVRVKPLSEYRHLVEEFGSFLMMMGEEVSTTWGDIPDRDRKHWINVFNTPEALGPQHDPDTSRGAMSATLGVAREVSRTSGAEVLVYLNHPNFCWNATAEDIANVPDLRHMEIYTALNSCNTFGDDVHCPVERMWDIALTLRLSAGGPLIYGLATDDCHAYTNHWRLGNTAMPGRAWICVDAEWLTPDHILGAVNRGAFYCSSGVELDEIDVREDGMSLNIVGVEGVHYTTKFIGSPRGVEMTGEPVLDQTGQEIRTTRTYSEEIGKIVHVASGTEVGYTFRGDELYVRAVVVSDVPHPNPTVPDDVQRAWTQPILPGNS